MKNNMKIENQVWITFYLCIGEYKHSQGETSVAFSDIEKLNLENKNQPTESLNIDCLEDVVHYELRNSMSWSGTISELQKINRVDQNHIGTSEN